MLGWIADLFTNPLDLTSKWWLGKFADRAEKKRPDWFRNPNDPE